VATPGFLFNFSTRVAHFTAAKAVAAVRNAGRAYPAVVSTPAPLPRVAPSPRRSPMPFFPHATLTERGVPCLSISRSAVSVMDKSNIAFALISVILGIYIAVALLLSRVRRSHMDKTGHHRTGHHRLANTGRN
jgi:hypothetical protein